MSGQQISVRQLLLVSLATALGPILCLMSQVLIASAGRDSWFSVLVGGAAATAAGAILVSLVRATPGDRHDLLEQIRRAIGTAPAWALGLLYVLVSLNIIQFSVRFAGEVLITGLTPATPVSVYVIGMLSLVAFAASQGLETVARLCELFVLPVVLFLGLIVAVSVPLMDFGDFMPVLVAPPSGIAYAMAASAGYLVEWALVGVAAAGCTRIIRGQSRTRAAAVGAGTAAAAETVALITVIAIVGPEEAGRLVFGFLHVTRQVTVFELVRGVESLFLFPWIVIIFLKSSLHMVTASLVLGRMLGIRPVPYLPAILTAGLIFPATLVVSEAWVVRSNLLITIWVMPVLLVLTGAALVKARRICP